MLLFRLFRAAPREGVYIHGLFLEGARWDSNLGVLAEARLKELHPPMPVVYVKVKKLPFRTKSSLLIFKIVLGCNSRQARYKRDL